MTTLRAALLACVFCLLTGPPAWAQEALTQDARAAEATVSNGLPEHVDVTQLIALPVDSVSLPDGLGTLIVPRPYLPTPADEPQAGARFSKATYLYLPDGGEGRLRLFCTVHYTLPSDAALAGRMARLLSLAHRTLTTQTGQPAANGDAPFAVWLCRDGRAGGEQWNANLYFDALDAPRSSIEWIREILHEYSHLALPPIGGYKAPEYWANGYLGERLLVRWLQRLPDGPAQVQRAWGDFSGAANFSRLLIAPALTLYARVGPNPKWLARTDADGMRYLIGQALTADDKYGGRVLGEAFALLPRAHEARAADLSDALGVAAVHHALARRP